MRASSAVLVVMFAAALYSAVLDVTSKIRARCVMLDRRCFGHRARREMHDRRLTIGLRSPMLPLTGMQLGGDAHRLPDGAGDGPQRSTRRPRPTRRSSVGQLLFYPRRSGRLHRRWGGWRRPVPRRRLHTFERVPIGGDLVRSKLRSTLFVSCARIRSFELGRSVLAAPDRSAIILHHHDRDGRSS